MITPTAEPTPPLYPDNPLLTVLEETAVDPPVIRETTRVRTEITSSTQPSNNREQITEGFASLLRRLALHSPQLRNAILDDNVAAWVSDLPSVERRIVAELQADLDAKLVADEASLPSIDNTPSFGFHHFRLRPIVVLK
jgi:hypothetical protein